MIAKFLLLPFLLLGVVFKSNSQITSGRYLAGGGFNLYSAKDDQLAPDTKTENFNINIQAGKVIKDNTVVGLILSYSRYRTVYSTIQVGKSNLYSAGVFYRKYKRLLKDLYLFGEADAVYLRTKNSQVYFQYTGDLLKVVHTGGSLSFIPGISYLFSNRMQVELLMPNIFSLSYSHVQTEYTSTTPAAYSIKKGNVFSANSTLNSNLLSSLGIGFKFLLGK